MSRFTHLFSQFRESLAMALAAVRASKLRSILTLLGVAVGVFSIIAVMTAVSVLRNSIEEGISQLGANTFQMQKFPVVMGDEHAMRRKYRNRKNISYEQAMAVKEKITTAEMVGIEGWKFGRTVVWNGQKTNPNIQVGGRMRKESRQTIGLSGTDGQSGRKTCRTRRRLPSWGIPSQKNCFLHISILSVKPFVSMARCIRS